MLFVYGRILSGTNCIWIFLVYLNLMALSLKFCASTHVDIYRELTKAKPYRRTMGMEIVMFCIDPFKNVSSHINSSLSLIVGIQSLHAKAYLRKRHMLTTRKRKPLNQTLSN